MSPTNRNHKMMFGPRWLEHGIIFLPTILFLRRRCNGFWLFFFSIVSTKKTLTTFLPAPIGGEHVGAEGGFAGILRRADGEAILPLASRVCQVLRDLPLFLRGRFRPQGQRRTRQKEIRRTSSRRRLVPGDQEPLSLSQTRCEI